MHVSKISTPNIVYKRWLYFSFYKCSNNCFEYSHKKRKDSLKGSLDWVLFAAEHEFPKILVPRFPKHTRNENTECTESQNAQNNWVLYIWPASWSTDIFIILILVCFQLMISGVNYVIYGCSFARLTPGVSLYCSLTLEKNIVAVITQDRVIDDNLKKQIKNQVLRTCILFLLT